MDPYASLKQGEDMLHLRKLLVIVRETVDGVGEHLLYKGLLISCMEEIGRYIVLPVMEWWVKQYACTLILDDLYR